MEILDGLADLLTRAELSREQSLKLRDASYAACQEARLSREQARELRLRQAAAETDALQPSPGPDGAGAEERALCGNPRLP